LRKEGKRLKDYKNTEKKRPKDCKKRQGEKGVKDNKNTEKKA
jgi:hypothetical protein